MKFYPNLTSLKGGMKTNEVRFLDNDQTLPYVLGQDKMYYYFAQNTKGWNNKPDQFSDLYVLVMTSSQDLQTEKESK